MGFFKNIGKAIKKNVSFKNLVKVATPIMGAIPIVGGAVQSVSQNLQDAHEAKKANRQAEADALNQQAYQTAGQAVGAVANAGTQMFAKGVTEGVYNGLSTGAKQGLGTVGAEVADSTLKAWFTKHWKQILIGLSIVGILYLIKKNMDKNPRRRVQRRR